MSNLTGTFKLDTPLLWPKSAPEILSLCKSFDIVTNLSQALAALSVPDAAPLRGDLQTLATNGMLGMHPVVLFVELNALAASELRAIVEFKNSPKGQLTHVIVLSGDISKREMAMLFRAGIEELLSSPIVVKDLAETLVRVKTNAAVAETSKVREGKIITFLPATGGAGATTLAVNAASLLAEAADEGQSSCIIDLDFQSGSVADQIDMQQYSPIAELAAAPERLDDQMLESMMPAAADGLRVLTAPSFPMPLDALQPLTVEEILAIARRRHRHVVVDLPHALTIGTENVLQRSNVIFVVLQLHIPAIRQTRRLLNLLNHGGMHDLPIKLVINRHQNNWANGEQLTFAQVEKVLERKINFTIPNEYELITTAINQGRPAVKTNPKSKYADAVRFMLSQACRVDFNRKPRSLLNAMSQLSRKSNVATNRN